MKCDFCVKMKEVLLPDMTPAASVHYGSGPIQRNILNDLIIMQLLPASTLTSTPPL